MTGMIEDPLEPSPRATFRDIAMRVVWIATPLIVLPGFASPYVAAKRILFDLGVAAAGFVLLLTRPNSLPKPPVPLRIFAVLGAFAVALSTVAHARSVALVLPAAALLASWTIWVWITASLADDRAFISDAVWIGLIQVVLGAFQIAGSPAAEAHPLLAGKQEFIGTLGNSDFVATWLAATVLAAAYGRELVFGKKLWLCVLIGGLALTGSRGAWLAAIVAVAVMEAPRLNIFTRLGRTAVVAAGAIGVAVSVALLFHGALPSAVTDPHTVRGRYFIWASALHVLRSAPILGIGLDHFQYRFFDAQHDLFASGHWSAFAANASQVTRVHNELLDFWLEGGLLLAGAWVLLIFCVWFLSRPYAEESRARGARAVLAYMVAASVASFPFHVVPNLMFIGLVVARLLRPAPDLAVLYRPVGRKGALLGMAVCAAVLVIEGRQAVAQIHLSRGEAAVDSSDRVDAGAHADAALRWGGFVYDAVFLRARAHYHAFDFVPALEDIARLERIGATADVLRLKGTILLDLGRWGDAETVFRRLAVAFPLQISPHYQLGRIYRELGRTDEARAEFREAVRLSPTSRVARFDQERSKSLLDQWALEDDEFANSEDRGRTRRHIVRERETREETVVDDAGSEQPEIPEP